MLQITRELTEDPKTPEIDIVNHALMVLIASMQREARIARSISAKIFPVSNYFVNTHKAISYLQVMHNQQYPQPVKGKEEKEFCDQIVVLIIFT
jgi:hypothetical protein